MSMVALAAFGVVKAEAQTIPGIPEPGLVVYGRLLDRGTQQPVAGRPVTIGATGGGDSSSVTARIVAVNGTTFYVANLPFETRVVSGTTLARSANTLELKAAATSYTRTATFGGVTASFLEPAAGQFRFGAADRGKVERADLLVDGGTPESPNVDTDGDGVADWAEAIAGTDPRNPNSVFQVDTDLSPAPGGGLVIQWASVAGRTYSIERSTDLGQGFTALPGGNSLAATPGKNAYVDATATGEGPYFYRISVR